MERLFPSRANVLGGKGNNASVVRWRSRKLLKGRASPSFSVVSARSQSRKSHREENILCHRMNEQTLLKVRRFTPSLFFFFHRDMGAASWHWGATITKGSVLTVSSRVYFRWFKLSAPRRDVTWVDDVRIATCMGPPLKCAMQHHSVSAIWNTVLALHHRLGATRVRRPNTFCILWRNAFSSSEVKETVQYIWLSWNTYSFLQVPIPRAPASTAGCSTIGPWVRSEGINVKDRRISVRASAHSRTLVLPLRLKSKQS